MFQLSAALDLQTVRTGQIDKALGSINNKLDKSSKKAQSFSDVVSLKTSNFAAYTVASAAVLKLTNAISGAVSEAIRFEKELIKISQIVRVSVSDAKAFSSSILDISKAYGISAVKVAETIKTLTQSGLSFDKARKSAELLAKTTLLSTFDNLSSTTEGLIAIFAQFNLSVKDAEVAIGSINALSKRYAVESSDLIDAVKRAGGAFSATGGKLEDLLAVFTTIRSTTRETSETIATGLRTIFTRLQRPKTIEYFRSLGIELTNLRGQFIGNLPAIQKISSSLERIGIQAGDIKFAEVVEQLGGIRQASRIIPLLTQQAKLAETVSVANRGLVETDEDVAKAKQSLAFRIDELRAKFSALVAEISQSASFKLLTTTLLSLADSLINVADALKPLIPLLTLFASIKLGQTVGKTFRTLGSGDLNKVSSGPLGYNRGGFIPGEGNGDTVPAMLTPGEFVINKKSAEAIGYGKLAKINKYAKGGPVQKFAGGGAVGGGDILPTGGLFSGLLDGLTSVATNFLVLDIASKTLNSSLSVFSNGVLGAAKSISNVIQARSDLNKKIKEQEEAVSKSSSLYANASIVLKDTVQDLRNAKVDNATQRASKQAAITQGGTSGTDFGAGVFTDPKDVASLKKSVQEVTRAYGENSYEVQSLNKILKDNEGNAHAQAKASKVYARTLRGTSDSQDAATIALENQVAALKEGAEGAKRRAEAERELADELKKQKKSNSIRGKVRGFFKSEGLKKAAPEIDRAVTVATAVLVTQFTNAAQAADKLANSAIEAGNAQEAGEATRDSLEAQRTGQDIQRGAMGGAAIGSLFGPLGAAIGKAAGAAIGYTGVITATTDLMGITNSKLETEIAVREAKTKATEQSLSKLTDSFSKESAVLEKSSIKAAINKTAEGINAFTDRVKKDSNVSFGGANSEAVQSQLTSQFENLSRQFETLSQLPENAGKSFDELLKENPELAKSLHNVRDNMDDASTSIHEGNAAYKLSRDTINTNSSLIQRQNEVRATELANQLALINIQKSLASSFALLDNVIAGTSTNIDRLDFALSGKFASTELSTSVSDLSDRNVATDGFKKSLDAASTLGPVFADQADKVRSSISGLDNFASEIATLKFGDKVEQSDLRNTLNKSGLADQADEILANVQKAIDSGEKLDTTKLTQDIFDQHIQPLADGLDQGRKLINERLKQQEELYGKQNDLIKKRTELALNTLKSEQSARRQIQEILKVDARPEVERGRRLDLAKTSLQGTSLSGIDLNNPQSFKDITLREKSIKLRQKEINQLTVDAGANEKFALQKEFSELEQESTKLKSAMDILADTTLENNAIQEKIKRSQERRKESKDAATQLAFGTSESRFDFFKSLGQAKAVSGAANADIVPEGDRSKVLSIFQQFKKSRIFNGSTGEEATNKVTANFLARMGVPLDQISNIMDDFIIGELEMVDVVRRNLSVDIDRNRLLGNIHDAIVNNRPIRAASGGPIYASQGSLVNFQKSGTDTVPAMLTPGEFVIKRDSVNKYGTGMMESINAGNFYDGGLVGGQNLYPEMDNLFDEVFTVDRRTLEQRISDIKKDSSLSESQVQERIDNEFQRVGVNNRYRGTEKNLDQIIRNQNRVIDNFNSLAPSVEDITGSEVFKYTNDLRNRKYSPKIEEDNSFLTNSENRREGAARSLQRRQRTQEDIFNRRRSPNIDPTNLRSRVNRDSEELTQNQKAFALGKRYADERRKRDINDAYQNRIDSGINLSLEPTTKTGKEKARKRKESKESVEAMKLDNFYKRNPQFGTQENPSFSQDSRFDENNNFNPNATRSQKEINEANENAVQHTPAKTARVGLAQVQRDIENGYRSAVTRKLTEKGLARERKRQGKTLANKSQESKSGIDFSKDFDPVDKTLLITPRQAKSKFLQAAFTKGRHLKKIAFNEELFKKAFGNNAPFDRADSDNDGFVNALELRKINPRNYRKLIERIYDSSTFNKKYSDYTSKLYGLNDTGSSASFSESVISGVLMQGKKITPQFNPNMAFSMDGRKTLKEAKPLLSNMIDAATKKGSIPYIINLLSNGQLSSNANNTLSGINTHLQSFNAGGKVMGKSGIDTNPAMLTRGEYVINKDSVSKYGIDAMEQINKGNFKGFAKGGSVSGSKTTSGTSQPAKFFNVEDLEIIKQSLSPFVNAVNNLIAMPKEIEVVMAPVSVSVNHNGMEIFSTIKSETQKMVMEHVSREFSKFVNDLNSGNIR
jgi:TP901 family phage tail tape measure protein